MKNEILINSIRNLTEVIKEQQEQILSYNGRIPQIELDIILQNIRTLYENIIALKKTSTELEPKQIEAVQEIASVKSLAPTEELVTQISFQEPVAKISEPVIFEERVAKLPVPEIFEERVAKLPEPEIEQELVSEITFQKTITPQHIQPELLLAEVETPVMESTTEITEEAVLPQVSQVKEKSRTPSKSNHTASLFDDHVTVAEKFKGSASVYDKFSAARQDNSVADKISKDPVADLKKSIGINEKFAFINELFDGDLNSYNDAIDQLNNSKNLEQANTILESNLLQKYNWSEESDAFIKLRNLVERRFV